MICGERIGAAALLMCFMIPPSVFVHEKTPEEYPQGFDRECVVYRTCRFVLCVTARRSFCVRQLS